MLRMLVHNTVNDYAAWRSVFDENTDSFAPSGLRLEWVRRNPDDAREVWFCLRVEDRARAEAYLSDPIHAGCHGLAVPGNPCLQHHPTTPRHGLRRRQAVAPILENEVNPEAIL
jgi:hypothetical protein